jgi:glycine oxidase
VTASPEVVVRGAGVAGLVTAVTLAERGAHVRVVEAGPQVGSGASWLAGGMLAPWCEGESAPPEVTRDSLASLDWWASHVPDVARAGTLVVAPPRDRAELTRFGRRTDHFVEVDATTIAELEPDLTGRFERGLFFDTEGHVDPRRALVALRDRLISLGGSISFDTPEDTGPRDWTIDARGLATRSEGLRGVRGEMLLLRCSDVTFHRPIRLLHPRMPVYVVPRADHIFMVGATMVESEDTRGMTLRAMSELTNAAYTLHPAFAEAEIVEMRANLRPSFPDNIPRVWQDGRCVHVNGMYRHGFLLSPQRAAAAAAIVFGDTPA